MNPRSWFIHTVTRRRRTSLGTHGDPTFGAQETFKARVEKRRAIVRNRSGEEVVAGSVLMTDVAVAFDDQVWLPSIGGEPADDVNDENAARGPLSLEQCTDKTGRTSLWKVYFA